MKTHFTLLLSIAVLFLYSSAMMGCNNSSTTTTTEKAVTSDDHEHGDDDQDHDHDDHAHDDHAHHDHDHGHEGHDHPAHGPHGGHMVELNSGKHAEWAHDDEKDKITVYPENAEIVTKIEMTTKVGDKVTPYEFEKAEVDGATVYELTSPELLTAIKMGDAVETNLVLTTTDGEMTAAVKHHSH